jgi:hypothetical protein
MIKGIIKIMFWVAHNKFIRITLFTNNLIIIKLTSYYPFSSVGGKSWTETGGS